MSAPVLVPIDTQRPPLDGVVASDRLFVVVRGGVFANRWWGVGEILACRQDDSEDGGEAVVVLEATGHGRPRLGISRRGRLLGEAGEPCHPLRWRTAGRVVASQRPKQLTLFAQAA